MHIKCPEIQIMYKKGQANSELMYTKMKYMLGKTWHLVWCHGMTSPCPGKNAIMHAFHKTNHHRGSFMVSRGKSPRLKGDPNFLCSLSMSFFYDEHTTCKSPCSNFALFWVHLPYLGDYVHFLSINSHNSSSNSRCMKGSTRTAWKTMHARAI